MKGNESQTHLVADLDVYIWTCSNKKYEIFLMFYFATVRLGVGLMCCSYSLTIRKSSVFL